MTMMMMLIMILLCFQKRQVSSLFLENNSHPSIPVGQKASGVPIANWMMFIQEQLMVGRGVLGPWVSSVRLLEDWATWGMAPPRICHDCMLKNTRKTLVKLMVRWFRWPNVHKNCPVHFVESAWISFANLHADNRPWLSSQDWLE